MSILILMDNTYKGKFKGYINKIVKSNLMGALVEIANYDND